MDRPPRRRGSSGEWRHDRLSRRRLLGSPSKKGISVYVMFLVVLVFWPRRCQDDVLLIRSFQGRDLC